MTIKSGWLGGRVWLLWLIASLVVVGGCASTSGDRPDAAATATDRTVESDDSGSASPGAQVVRIDKYGISFEIPAGWMTIDAKNILDASNPAVKELAGRMGVDPEQFVESLGSSVLTFSITDEGAVDGFVDNVNSVDVPQADVNDDQLKLELASIGAKPERFEHASSPAGEITRVPYTLAVSGTTVHGIAIVVDVGDAATSITVSSHSPAKAEELGDQIQSSLRPID